jgi:hypothetical protein
MGVYDVVVQGSAGEGKEEEGVACEGREKRGGA